MVLPHKMARWQQWCNDLNLIQPGTRYDFVFVDDEGFTKYRPKSFQALLDGFRAYKS